MEDAVVNLGRRIAEASRLAVLAHLEAVFEGLKAETPVRNYRRRLTGGKVEEEEARLAGAGR